MERRDASAARRAAAAAIGAAALALALTGCGAGQHAETSKMQTALSGIDADAGKMVLRNVQIDFGVNGSYPEGGQAPLRVWIGNKYETAVTLESVTSPDAEAVTLATEVVAVEETESPTDAASESPSGEASESPSGEASPDASASPSADASASPGTEEEVVDELVGERDFTLEFAPGEIMRLAPTAGSFLLLEGLKKDVDMGTSVTLVFTFSNGESATIAVPVGDPDVSPERSYFGDPGEHAAE
ncbi:hypothetical protein [Glycomyces artemisiae]|uniref:Copper(I)-binding protein n=1 Tax=Glycomyces artemisiae TaxID=1076443 RepID=A0A2T0UF45_9ACTN|nr:hypothetical protein [Glycomyces artemisiae]PRY56561.1 hypothetical protein B0I28_109210 [Glycomyces artemisiae]